MQAIKWAYCKYIKWAHYQRKEYSFEGGRMILGHDYLRAYSWEPYICGARDLAGICHMSDKQLYYLSRDWFLKHTYHALDTS